MFDLPWLPFSVAETKDDSLQAGGRVAEESEVRYFKTNSRARTSKGTKGRCKFARFGSRELRPLPCFVLIGARNETGVGLRE